MQLGATPRRRPLGKSDYQLPSSSSAKTSWDSYSRTRPTLHLNSVHLSLFSPGPPCAQGSCSVISFSVCASWIRSSAPPTMDTPNTSIPSSTLPPTCRCSRIASQRCVCPTQFEQVSPWQTSKLRTFCTPLFILHSVVSC